MRTGHARGGLPVLLAGLLAGTLAAGLTGCAGSHRGGSDSPGVKLPQSVAPGPAGDAQRMSVNGASEKDIAAKLRANGVDDAERWAQVIADNQPYPADDPSLVKLRSVLAQQGADQATVDRITNSLAP